MAPIYYYNPSPTYFDYISTLPQSEGARDVADYKVTVTTDTINGQTVVVEVTGRTCPADEIAATVAKATQAGLNAKTAPTPITINVNGSVMSGDDLARAVKDATRRHGDGFGEVAV